MPPVELQCYPLPLPFSVPRTYFFWPQVSVVNLKLVVPCLLRGMSSKLEKINGRYTNTLEISQNCKLLVCNINCLYSGF